jgi:methionine-rich copper-binding protein CopC
MMRLTRRSLPLLLAAIAAATPAFAHSTLRASTPASGSVLGASPPAISLEFNEATRLVSVVVVTGETERRLRMTPSGSGIRFTTTAAPNLPRGRNAIRWRAISRDGHPVEGTIIIVIR